ncbi:cobalt transporter CbiM [Pectinatus brassicae]|uniref:Cobalt/nickel transport system permease protein n=1 Tax=Pectinatus brassicae TaxID=862415 RepID=A0A840UI34_9FIRM|nr:cobalt transporter CbiM [Pectinatus brassicae]MBB5335217.1 cobalt/nickel transport system permease protein [Pectinatus brassicae]
MHIPDNYLSPSTCAVFTAAMLPVWYYSIRKIKMELPKDKIPLIGVGAAFSFLLMMFNLPIPGGTTAHAVGGTLIALLLGPYAACIAISVALFIQALVFGDGGILSFAANCFNMAFVLPFAGYYTFRFIRNLFSSSAGEKIAILLGAYVGINMAAFVAAIEFGVQPLLFTNSAGQALYSPYPLAVAIPAMLLPHLLIAGIAEAVFTLAIYEFIAKVSPGLIQDNKKQKLNPIFALLIVLIIASPLGLLASGTAWGEWGADEIAADASLGTALGYIPAKIANGFSYDALLPDYTMAGMSDVMGYILSAVIGAALLIIVFKIIGTFVSERKRTV